MTVFAQAERLQSFITEIFARAGSSATEAGEIAHHLVEANLSGHDSHGVGMVPAYMLHLKQGFVKPNQAPVRVGGTDPFAVFDGQMGYGQPIIYAVMRQAADIARRHGTALVTVRNAQHIGRVGAYAEMLSAQGLMSLHFVNAVYDTACVAPYRGTDPRLMTNPVCIAIPGSKPLLLDFATSAIAMGKVRVAYNKGEPVAPGRLIDASGQPTQDPAVLFEAPKGALVPFGDHKGWGLALFAEILGGALTGGPLSGQNPGVPHGLVNGIFSVVLEPGRLVDGGQFDAAVRALTDYVKASPAADADNPVLVPGEPERDARRLRGRDGIPIDETTWKQLRAAAGALGVEVPEFASIDEGKVSVSTATRADTRAASPLPAAMAAALQAHFGDRFSVGAAVREHHGRDESRFAPTPPDAVVFARSNEDVALAVKLCRQYKVPIIPYGVGSSVEGQLLAVQGGLSIDLSQMNAVVQVRAEDLCATVQAGVTRKQLNEAIRHTGLFFPIDPGADASIGGMCATRASGTNAVRYGTMRENVLGVTVVDADGDIIKTQTLARKSSAGYDMKSLYVGSEGTLGVITEATVKLYPVPEAMSAAVCTFESLQDAIDTVIAIIQVGVPVARCEYLCPVTIRMINAYSKTTLREAHTLFFEFHGSEASAREQAQTAEAIADDHRGQGFEWTTHAEERTRLWTARHNALFAGLASRPGSKPVITDTCVPISRLADCITAARAILDQTSSPTNIAGHVGDGNFHCGILVDPNDAAEVALAEQLNEQIVRLALSMGGTCTGEHGIGLHKMEFLREEAGDKGVELMRRVKRALDPDGLFNPGKIFSMEG